MLVSLTPVHMKLLVCRVIVTDEQGTAWVGSESGNVRRVTLKQGPDPNSTQPLSLEVAQTFKRYSTSRSTSQRLGSSSMESIPDDFSRVDSAHPTDDPLGSDKGSAEGSTGGLAGGLAGIKAHAGPVSAIEIHKGHVFTSGGTQNSAALIEWDSKGMMVHTHNLKELGMPSPQVNMSREYSICAAYTMHTHALQVACSIFQHHPSCRHALSLA